MAGEAVEYADTPTANNTTFQLYNPFESRQDIVRIDFQATANQRIHGRYLHDEYNLIEPYGTFSGAALPTVPTDRSRPGTSYQVGHTYVISPNADQRSEGRRVVERPAHQAAGRLLAARHLRLRVPGALRHAGLRRRAASRTSTVSAASRRSTGPSFALLSPTTDITVQDTLTWVTRRPLDPQRRRRSRATARTRTAAATTSASIAFNNGGNPNSTSNAPGRRAARQLPHLQRGLGRSGRLLPLHHLPGRSSRTRGACARTCRLEVGVRYEYSTPTYTQGNNLVNFDPSRYDPTQAVTVQANGLLVPGVGNRFNGLVDRRRRHPGGSAGARRAARRAATTTASRSARRAGSTTRSTCSCRASASPTR